MIFPFENYLSLKETLFEFWLLFLDHKEIILEQSKGKYASLRVQNSSAVSATKLLSY